MSSVNTQNKESENPETQPVITTPEETSIAVSEQNEQTAEQATVQAQPQFDTRSLREITVEIPADVVSKQWDKTVRSLSKEARIPGFRPGKVPASLIRARYADHIKEDIINTLGQQYCQEAIQKEGQSGI